MRSVLARARCIYIFLSFFSIRIGEWVSVLFALDVLVSPPKWHVHVNIVVIYTNWRWNNKYFLVSNRIVVCVCAQSIRKDLRFSFFLLGVFLLFLLFVIDSISFKVIYVHGKKTPNFVHIHCMLQSPTASFLTSLANKTKKKCHTNTHTPICYWA